MMNRLVRLLLSVSAGLMLSLSWLGFPGWILFAAFLPLLLIDDYYVNNPVRRGSFHFWCYSAVAFLTWNIMTTWWIIHATPIGAFLAIVANSLLMSLFFLLGHLIRTRSRKTTGYLAIAALWLSFEMAHYHWDIEWPWLNLGNGFANNPALVQWYEYTGVLGGSLWIWMVNILLYFFLKRLAAKTDIQRVMISGATLLMTIFLPLLVSFLLYRSYIEKPDPRKVLIIQPNIDPYSETHSEGALNDKLLRYIRITESHIHSGTDYIVGPETVFEQDWNEAKLPDYPAIRRLQKLTKEGGNSSLIIGASTYRFYNDMDKVPQTARHTHDGKYYDVFNTAIFTDSAGNIQTYHKSILVSGVEKMPFRKYLKFLDSFIINLGGTTGSLGKQPEPENFTAGNGDRIAPAICYESVFGEYLARFVRKGAHAIFIITNDGWWKNTPGYRQHFSFARLRAIETRRSIVRSANTGISGIINQRGDVVLSSRWWVEDALEGSFNLNNQITFYVRYGDYIGRISVLISVLLLIKSITERILKTKNRTNSNCVKPR